MRLSNIYAIVVGCGKPMKKIIALFITILSMACIGCEKTMLPSDSLNTAGNTIPVAQPRLDLGTVRIVCANNVPMATDEANKKRILSAVSDKLGHDRNVSVTLLLASYDKLPDQIKQMCAAGDPPEIAQWWPAVYKARDPLPLPLSDALARYGQYLNDMTFQQHLPDYMIQGNVYGLPCVCLSAGTVVANQTLLDEYGWAVPTSLQQMDSMLRQAHEQGAVPYLIASVDYVSQWFGVPLPTAIYKTQTGLQIGCRLPQYRAYLETMVRWRSNGWIVSDSKAFLYDATISTPQWLFTSLSYQQIALCKDATPVKPFPAAGGPPMAAPTSFSPYGLCAYAKPEALVLLMDWLAESKSNVQLLTIGEEQTDYALAADGTLQTIKGGSWIQGSLFWMNGLHTDLPLPNATNTEAAMRAINNCSENNNGYIIRLLPATASFAKKGSSLAAAQKGFDQYLELCVKDSLVINGKMNIDEYEQLLRDNEHLLLPYIELVSQYLDGMYNPGNDMTLIPEEQE